MSILESGKICAAIITYNPNINRLKKNIKAIYKQVEKIIIVDNASTNIEEIFETIKEISNVSLSREKENGGIAKALNKSFLLAKKEEYEWVLTLDQDSICAPDLIFMMKNHMKENKVAIIAPEIVYENSRIKEEIENSVEEIKACMTSGSLTRVVSWEKTGGFDENMFIDFVDNDFCQKLKMHGYKIIRIQKATLFHQLGEAYQYRLGRFVKTYFHHTSIRNYYIVRNYIYFIKRHKSSINVNWYFLRLLYNTGQIIIFERPKIENLKAIIKGFHDGITLKIEEYKT